MRGLLQPGGMVQELAGRKLDPIWRAPGGKVSPNTLAAARACGYAHAGWAKAGFSGDQLPQTAPDGGEIPGRDYGAGFWRQQWLGLRRMMENFGKEANR